MNCCDSLKYVNQNFVILVMDFVCVVTCRNESKEMTFNVDPHKLCLSSTVFMQQQYRSSFDINCDNISEKSFESFVNYITSFKDESFINSENIWDFLTLSAIVDLHSDFFELIKKFIRNHENDIACLVSRIISVCEANWITPLETVKEILASRSNEFLRYLMNNTIVNRIPLEIVDQIISSSSELDQKVLADYLLFLDINNVCCFALIGRLDIQKLYRDEYDLRKLARIFHTDPPKVDKLTASMFNLLIEQDVKISQIRKLFTTLKENALLMVSQVNVR